MFQFGSVAYYVIITFLTSLAFATGYFFDSPWIGSFSFILLVGAYMLYTVFSGKAKPVSRAYGLSAALCPLLLSTVGVNLYIIFTGSIYTSIGVKSGLFNFLITSLLLLAFVQIDKLWPASWQ